MAENETIAYINDPSAAGNFRDAAEMAYFVDKTDLISEVVSLMKTAGPFLCVTRPRRFGKTYGANMIAAFFGKAGLPPSFFASMKVGKDPEAMEHCGKYNVVFLHGDKVSAKPVSGNEYAELIRSHLISELRVLYPQAPISPESSMSDAFSSIRRHYRGEKLVFVVDEWDYLLSRDWTNEQDHKDYLAFLRNMFKDEGIVKLAYLTGVLPMPVFSSTSDLNMFQPLTMSGSCMLSTCFGFTEEEVDELHRRYCAISKAPILSREDLRDWYEGYTCAEGVSIYNPQSVVFALSHNSLVDYWSRSGKDDEIFACIAGSESLVQNDIARLISHLAVSFQLKLGQSPSRPSATRREVLSRMVTLGFLSYYNGEARIPNKEIMMQFERMAEDEPELFQMGGHAGKRPPAN